MSPPAPGLDPARTALVLIDLMDRMVALPLAPYPGAAVLEAALGLARTFRGAGAPVVAVRGQRAGAAHQPPGSALVAEVADAADLVVVKHTVGAFQDTALHAGLQERGVRTLVLAGIATHLSVESTARAAADLGYDLVFAADAMSGMTAAEHESTVALDFPRFGTVLKAAEVEFRRG
ncbi:Nicotinamidase-related amidase [Streptomyces sp. DvalAA-14]|uniref:isochorismatase family protein n=1 Tax=unclassified Streptomyces TaxID=2593676 RepID=UPI00081B8580|nr:MULTISPECIES: isochorismatase family protein [unclassified Streptomyces]MYS19680.1 isochorismatase family protein [Streptomyces sp. SID4948]SCD50502.1 Nicotinamidase-related amidase [Streptomyces sp. DvalAA-14]